MGNTHSFWIFGNDGKFDDKTYSFDRVFPESTTQAGSQSDAHRLSDFTAHDDPISSIQKIIKQPISALFESRAIMTSLKVKIQVQNYRSAPTDDQIPNYIIFSHVIN